jgi:hypothetical protein
MGAKVKREKLYFVSFEPIRKFRCFLSVEAVVNSKKDLAPLLAKASDTYENAIRKMTSLIAEIEAARANRKLVSAHEVWELGDVIFTLRADLEGLGLQLDGVYDHLIRDLGVKRKWLEKVIIFRRCLPDKQLIPVSLNWARCRSTPRRAAERLRAGLPLGQIWNGHS